MMKVQLTRKFAECLDGIDLSHSRVGDVLDLPDREAELLIAERWAVPDVSSHRPRYVTTIGDVLERLRHVREQMEQNRFEQVEHRRAEDHIREELQDSRAKTLHD